MRLSNKHILYQDDDLIVVHKPAHLLTIPDRFRPELPNVKGFLLQQFEEAYTVHRLDRETSGLIIFGRHKEAHRNLSLQFQNRTVTKKYLAIVEGNVKADLQKVDAPLAEVPNQRGKMRVQKGGKPSITSFEVMERFCRFSLVAATLHTGRLHQIRVHLTHIGHPIVADPIYGDRSQITIADIKTTRLNIRTADNPRPLVARTALHAFSLTIKHPRTEELRTWEAPLPKDLNACLKQLRKWDQLPN